MTNLVANILKKIIKLYKLLVITNNSIGLPLSIMRAEDDTEYFVLKWEQGKLAISENLQL